MTEQQIEISKNNSVDGRGGARPGAGRPLGSMNAKTMERAKIKQAFEDRVAKNADKLFNVQFNLAGGEQYLMWKHQVGNGDKKRTVVEVVDDLEVIKQFLDETLDVGSDEYYYISTKPANGMAIDSLLDRAFGKAPQKMEMEHSGEIGTGTGNTAAAAQYAEFLKTGNC